MNRWIILPIIVCLGLVLNACADTSTVVEGDSSETGTVADLLVGFEVMSPAGERFGQVEGVLLNTKNGEVCYVIISFKDPTIYGKTAMVVPNTKYVPLPWTRLTPNPDKKMLIVDTDEVTFDQAPHVDTLPASLSSQLEAEVKAYWSDR